MAENFEQQINKILKTRIKNKTNVKNLKSTTLKKACKALIKSMKKVIAKGISPITGRSARFPGYKNPKKGYPTSVRHRFPAKKRRPVNLKLSGKFLKKLKFRVGVGKKAFIDIGFFDKYGKTLEEGHREGAGGQPERPIIPTGKEAFRPIVIKDFKSVIVEAFKKIVAK